MKSFTFISNNKIFLLSGVLSNPAPVSVLVFFTSYTHCQTHFQLKRPDILRSFYYGGRLFCLRNGGSAVKRHLDMWQQVSDRDERSCIGPRKQDSCGIITKVFSVIFINKIIQKNTISMNISMVQTLYYFIKGLCLCNLIIIKITKNYTNGVV